MCGLGHSNLSQLVKKGKGPPYIEAGTTRLFHPERVREWLEHYRLTIRRRKHDAR